MAQRITAFIVALCVLAGGVATVATSASAGGGGTVADAAAGKKKKKKKKKKAPPPQIAVGTYSGTTSNGIPVSLTLNGDRASGTMTYCAMTAPLQVSGTVFKVAYIEPFTGDTIYADGGFNALTKQATGFMSSNGCDASNTTFTLQGPTS